MRTINNAIELKGEVKHLNESQKQNVLSVLGGLGLTPSGIRKLKWVKEDYNGCPGIETRIGNILLTIRNDEDDRELTFFLNDLSRTQKYGSIKWLKLSRFGPSRSEFRRYQFGAHFHSHAKHGYDEPHIETKNPEIYPDSEVNAHVANNSPQMMIEVPKALRNIIGKQLPNAAFKLARKMINGNKVQYLQKE